jgi:hypothetical protein
LPPVSAGFLLGLLFKPEDGGEIFLRNVEVELHGVTIQNTTFFMESYLTFISGVSVEEGTLW